MITNESKKMLKDMSGDEIKAILNTPCEELERHSGAFQTDVETLADMWIGVPHGLSFDNTEIYRQKPKKLSVNELCEQVWKYQLMSRGTSMSPDNEITPTDFRLILELIKQTEGYTP